MHNDTWQMQEAKARLSEVVSASQHKPQVITVRGEEKSVVLSRDYYINLQQRAMGGTGKKKKTAGSFGEYLAKSPLSGANLRIDRNPETIGEIKW